MSINLENLFNKGIEVYLTSREKQKQKLDSFDQLSEVIAILINNIYNNEPTKKAVIHTLTEASLNLEHAAYNACAGFYNNSVESLRKVLELAIFGIYFDNNIMDYQGWLYGNEEYRFGSKLKYVFQLPQFSRYTTFNSTNLKNEINDLYKFFSQYTHSNPARWEQTTRITTVLTYDDQQFCHCMQLLQRVVQLVATVSVMYIPSTLDEPFEGVINPAILTEIKMQGGF